ncbi:molybdopterin biosynthesis protein MoeY [Rugamonas sp.]|uniref:molybdopterin biosynthesis protein MoeY n=1 Tax=Rugamonas sp. TaxID=1926287 RepID=UPI0025FDB155|nr:molybdopterin biosynthesis protein MoeY [Rugamonas sp.]
MNSIATLVKILDLARWAPSGDNTQVWEFDIVAVDHVTIYCHDTRDHCVYDLHGHPSQISYGALLETLSIAASGHGLRADVVREGDELRPVFQVRLSADPALRPSSLIASIERRTVQRRPLLRRPLTTAEKRALEAAVGGGFHIQWLEGPERRRAAWLMYKNARLRLTMPEAFEVHRSIIEWDARHSLDKVPDQALGVDAMTTKLMRWAMHSWPRMKTMNTVLGTWAPRLQMDLIPGLACAAHYVIKADRAPQTIDDYVAAGRAVQRFWLTLTGLGLLMQPEMTPLIFTSYLRQGIKFSVDPALERGARALEGEMAALIEQGAGYPVYMGRLGAGPQPHARSLRKPLGQLLR